MNLTLSTADRTAIDALVAALEAAWNSGDGDAFGAPFAVDADFVNIRAEHHRGRAEIAAGHAAILRTIYAGSTNHYTIETARLLHPDMALVHVHAVLDAPSGPLAGRNRALFSMVLARVAEAWQIASFHNTLQPPAADRH
ncbi:MAG: SgcJ/EcaC family oxidoreductase [Acidobacteriota bacterium]